MAIHEMQRELMKWKEIIALSVTEKDQMIPKVAEVFEPKVNRGSECVCFPPNLFIILWK
jgi:hypothetical protein